MLDHNPLVQRMAEQLVLYMGLREAAYLRWAVRHAQGALRSHIESLIDRMAAGEQADSRQWPAVAACRPLLESRDEVTAIMAAQCIAMQPERVKSYLTSAETARISGLLASAQRRPWHVRYHVAN